MPVSRIIGADTGGTLDVDEVGAIENQSERSFSSALLRHQQPLDVGVLDDRYLWAGRILVPRMSALGSLTRILQGMQVARIAERHRTESNADARLVHHVEHAEQAAVFFADQPPVAIPAFTEVEHRVRGTAKAHLVIEPTEHDVVALPEAAVVVDAIARHDKQ